jgi:hypothetical protein
MLQGRANSQIETVAAAAFVISYCGWDDVTPGGVAGTCRQPLLQD